MTPEEFRTAAHALVDWIADHRERIPQLPVAARVAPGEVAAGLAEHAPEAPEPLEDVLKDLEQVVVRVTQEGRTVSHMAKHTRGEVTRHLLETGADPARPQGLARVLGERWTVELAPPPRPGKPWTIDIVLPVAS